MISGSIFNNNDRNEAWQRKSFVFCVAGLVFIGAPSAQAEPVAFHIVTLKVVLTSRGTDDPDWVTNVFNKVAAVSGHLLIKYVPPNLPIVVGESSCTDVPIQH